MTTPFPLGRWDHIEDSNEMAGPVEAESLDNLGAGPAQPFNDSTTLAMVHRSGSLTPSEDCRHSWFKVSGSDRFSCHHCGMVAIFSSEP